MVSSGTHNWSTVGENACELLTIYVNGTNFVIDHLLSVLECNVMLGQSFSRSLLMSRADYGCIMHAKVRREVGKYGYERNMEHAIHNEVRAMI
jgi:hypothetical protein